MGGLRFDVSLGEFFVTAGPVGFAMFIILFGHSRLQKWANDPARRADKRQRVFADWVQAGFWVFCAVLFSCASAVWVHKQLVEPRVEFAVRGAIFGMPPGHSLLNRSGPTYVRATRRENDTIQDIRFIYENENRTGKPRAATFEITEGNDVGAALVVCRVAFVDPKMETLTHFAFEYESATPKLVAHDVEHEIVCSRAEADSGLEEILGLRDERAQRPGLATGRTDFAALMGLTAHAQENGVSAPDLLTALADPDPALQKAAREALAQSFATHRVLAYDVMVNQPRDSLLWQNVAWALSRHEPLLRQDLFADPDIPDDVWRVVIAAATDDDKASRTIARRIVATYPHESTRAVLERYGKVLGVRDSALYHSLLRHYDYNRGVLIPIAMRRGIANPGVIAASTSLESALGSAKQWSETDPSASRDALKVEYGTGFLAAVAAQEQAAGYTEDMAKSRFRSLLTNMKSAESSDQNPAHRVRAQTYIDAGYSAAFE